MVMDQHRKAVRKLGGGGCAYYPYLQLRAKGLVIK